MPEMRFVVQWPDETVTSCYSPSLVIKDYLTVGQSYAIPDFMERCRSALSIASERVKAKYGFYCTGASSQLEELERIAVAYPADEPRPVTVLRFQSS